MKAIRKIGKKVWNHGNMEKGCISGQIESASLPMINLDLQTTGIFQFGH